MWKVLESSWKRRSVTRLLIIHMRQFSNYTVLSDIWPTLYIRKTVQWHERNISPKYFDNQDFSEAEASKIYGVDEDVTDSLTNENASSTQQQSETSRTTKLSQQLGRFNSLSTAKQTLVSDQEAKLQKVLEVLHEETGIKLLHAATMTEEDLRKALSKHKSFT